MVTLALFFALAAIPSFVIGAAVAQRLNHRSKVPLVIGLLLLPIAVAGAASIGLLLWPVAWILLGLSFGATIRGQGGKRPIREVHVQYDGDQET